MINADKCNEQVDVQARPDPTLSIGKGSNEGKQRRLVFSFRCCLWVQVFGRQGGVVTHESRVYCSARTQALPLRCQKDRVWSDRSAPARPLRDRLVVAIGTTWAVWTEADCDKN